MKNTKWWPIECNHITSLYLQKAIWKLYHSSKKNLYPWVTLFQTTPSCFGTCLLRSQVSHPGVWAPVLRDAPPSAESPHRRPPPGGQWRWPPDHCRVPWHEARWRHSSMLGWLMQQKDWQGDGKWWWWIYMFEKPRIHTNPLNMIAGFNQNVLEHFMIFPLPTLPLNSAEASWGYMSVRCQFLHHHAHLLHRKASGEQDFQLLAHPLARQDERRSSQLRQGFRRDRVPWRVLTALRSLKLLPESENPVNIKMHQNARI